MTYQHTPYDQDNVIINEPTARSRIILLRDLILTVLVWVLYFYLMRDSYSFFSDFYHWVSGGFRHTSSYASFPSAFNLFVRLMVIALIINLFFCWSTYNMFRFAGKRRRRTVRPLRETELCAYYDIDPATLELWQNARHLVIHHDAEGNVWKISENEERP